MEDNLLLERVQNGDTTAFRQMFDLYWESLYLLASQKSGDGQEAEDMVQELFIDIWRKKERVTLTTSLKTYLVSCIYLKVFHYFRKKGFRQQHYADFACFLDQVEEHPPFENEYGRLQDIVEETVTLMPPQMQTVFTMKHYQGLTVKNIAEKLDISPSSVKTHLKIAMSRLHKAGKEHPGILLLLLMMDRSY